MRPIHRARAATDPAIDEIARIAHEAARTHTRHLVLVTGVPGSGKTLVGLCAVHNPALDDLAVERAGGKPSAPAIFLSGNGPLVQVLQYELRGAGGGGKTFVRDVKNYVKQCLGDKGAIPPHHLIVYDEAQRAWDLDKVVRKHGLPFPKSEPEAFVDFGERIPEWCEPIHDGEEAGLGQWRTALEGAGDPAGWTVHAPQQVLDEFFAPAPTPPAARPQAGAAQAPLAARTQASAALELRFHFADDLGEWVELLLEGDEDRRSCRQLTQCVTEFGAQGLELDAVLLAWGTDLIRTAGPGAGALFPTGASSASEHWTNELAKQHARSAHVKDSFRLRLNAYRALLTRGRDGAVVFVPPDPRLDLTAAWLEALGVKALD